jgi:hypothetical protein
MVGKMKISHIKLSENILYKLTSRLPFGVRPCPLVLVADPSATPASITDVSNTSAHTSSIVAHPRTAAIWLKKLLLAL